MLVKTKPAAERQLGDPDRLSKRFELGMVRSDEKMCSDIETGGSQTIMKNTIARKQESMKYFFLLAIDQ